MAHRFSTKLRIWAFKLQSLKENRLPCCIAQPSQSITARLLVVILTIDHQVIRFSLKLLIPARSWNLPVLWKSVLLSVAI